MQVIPQTVFVKLMGMPWQDAAIAAPGVFADMCFQGQMAGIVAKAQAAGVQNAQVYNQNGQQPFGLFTIQPAIAFWVLTGTTSNGTPVSEYVGNLIDRMTTPNPFIDGTGGPNLKIKDYPAEGYATLCWGQ